MAKLVVSCLLSFFKSFTFTTKVFAAISPNRCFFFDTSTLIPAGNPPMSIGLVSTMRIKERMTDFHSPGG
ncbi:hypothetical protein [Brevibacillus parabrevis]|uniref:Secreted protein n=1 Tax=Brevibacillus parabrevis TaxID=54914 RepID=A0A4Y3PKL8_BREPA|nr:hypothetical protein [Brevibacillus parabrevis]GEB33385.1 hypothetical protein BPA01_29650 [Brevibacillus parabrevis]